MKFPRFQKEWLLYGFAGMGMSFATVTIAQSQPELERVEPRGPMNTAPYFSTISASAIVEPASESIRIIPEIDGRITDVFVSAGDYVSKGDVLYRLDTSILRAAFGEAEAAVARARAEIALQDSEIDAARTELEGARLEASQFIKTVKRYRPLLPDGISPDEFDQFVNDADKAVFVARKAENNLTSVSLKKETAIHDLHLTEANLAAARAKLAQTVLRSPIKGRVLSVDLRIGDVIRSPQSMERSVTVGAVQILHLRTEIDETEAGRFRDYMQAVAYLRGVEHEPINLRFQSIDPIFKQKTNFLSTSSERLDSRVLEVTYAMDIPANLPVYVGQLVDVYINTNEGGSHEELAVLDQNISEPTYERPTGITNSNTVSIRKPVGTQSVGYASPDKLRD